MKKYYLLPLFLLLNLLFLQTAKAQLDNSGFEQPIEPDTTLQTPFSFILRATGFNKNNEYFNKIVKGYTLFGYRVTPAVGWQIQENLKVEGGIFLQRDFGNGSIKQALPFFSILFNWRDSQLLFGNINGSIHHNQIEPLEDFERLLYDVPENGIQYVWNTPKIHFDAWINWETMIYPLSDFQEEVSGGISSFYRLRETNISSMKLHYQFKTYHRAGQIDVIDEPLTTLFNNAIGLSYEQQFSSKWINGFKIDGYGLQFNDYSLQPKLPYINGNAAYLNGTLKTHFGDVMLSYWYGDQFISYKGGRLYQSYSTNEGSRYFEDVRQLLILRFLNHFKIGDAADLVLRFEPHWDLENNDFEFSHGLYVNLFTKLPIKK